MGALDFRPPGPLGKNRKLCYEGNQALFPKHIEISQQRKRLQAGGVAFQPPCIHCIIKYSR